MLSPQLRRKVHDLWSPGFYNFLVALAILVQVTFDT